MDSSEYNEIITIINELKRRKYKLELQLAKFGANADPAIETQIEDIDERIAAYERRIYQSQQVTTQNSSVTPPYWRPIAAIGVIIVRSYLKIQSK